MQQLKPENIKNYLFVYTVHMERSIISAINKQWLVLNFLERWRLQLSTYSLYTYLLLVLYMI